MWKGVIMEKNTVASGWIGCQRKTSKTSQKTEGEWVNLNVRRCGGPCEKKSPERKKRNSPGREMIFLFNRDNEFY